VQKIHIFSHTHRSFSKQIADLLGKGHIHAGLMYEEFFRTGKIEGNNAAFNNARNLFHDIFHLTDCSLPEVIKHSSDGKTGKFLLRTHDKLEIESVLIPMQSGGTLCVSSQVGCRMGCTFCETGRMGLLRNLTVAEIISQVFAARHLLGFKFKNVVFMGMGEPFDNFDNVMQAVEILNDPKGLAFGRKQVTISTSGCIEGIDKLAKIKNGPNLAVSINAPTDMLRNKIMPINRKHNLEKLYNAIKYYCDVTGRQVLAAYVLLKEINDREEHAEQLASFLQGLDVKVNLIPYNPQSCDRFLPPDPAILDAFALKLRKRGFYTLVRNTKGKDIMAACGQLGNVLLRKKLATERNSESRIQNSE